MLNFIKRLLGFEQSHGAPKKTLDRESHLKWAQDRALAKKTDKERWSSFVSDMKKHPELKHHPILGAGTDLIQMRALSGESLKSFIKDFE